MERQETPLPVTRVLGLSRSGNHAIINWMLEQLPGRWCFLNCVAPDSNPFRTAKPTDLGQCYRSNVPGFEPWSEGAGLHASIDHLLFSHEDCFLRSAWGERATAMQDEAIGTIRRRVDLLILRDPYNLFASRRRFRHQLVPEGAAVRIWKQHARAFLGHRTCLTRPVLPISYNRWREDPQYRQQLAERLDLRFTDADLDAVPACGGGSSFDGHRFQGRASEMPVHERWKHFADDASFWGLFDAQLRDFATRIFGPPPWEDGDREAQPESGGVTRRSRCESLS